MKYLQILLFSALFFISFNTLAQTNGVIVGNIRDINTKEAIPGATINVEGTDFNTVSDIDGNYKLTIPVGTYNLTANFLGYQSLNKYNIVLTSGNAQIINFELSQSSSNLQEVVINFNQNKSAIAADMT